MASVYGENLKITIFGQSHASAIGVTIDGLPAKEKLDREALAAFLARRAPGNNAWSTPRREADVPEFLCGVIDDVTCGAPLTAVIRNTNTRSSDYETLRRVPRPGHADYTAAIKFHGAQDAAGGGHFSGRLTAALCIAGGICLQLLQKEGISVMAHILSIGAVQEAPFDSVHVGRREEQLLRDRDFPTLSPSCGEAMKQVIAEARCANDSVGGVIECAVTGLPVGLGDPIFDGMENRIALAVFGIPAVKGIEFGDGFAAAALRGSEHNDAFVCRDGEITLATNHAGGILGGITNGMPLLFRAAVKPTPSIAREQESVDLTTGQGVTLSVPGRHDPCIVPRAVPCVEAAAAIAVYDALLAQRRLAAAN